MGTTTDSGSKYGAYVMTIAPEGVIFIEKPGRGRGLEFPGGHGKPEDGSLEECGARELYEEVGVEVDPEDMRIIGEEKVLPTHTSGIFLAQIGRLPKTLKHFGDGGEIIHIVKQRDLGTMRAKIFPPHRLYFDMALKLLDGKRAQKE